MKNATAFRSCPETLRSAGTAPKAVPVRMLATASFEALSPRKGVVEIVYSGNDAIFSCFVVETGRASSSAALYEAAYAQAASRAAEHGHELDRFVRI